MCTSLRLRRDAPVQPGHRFQAEELLLVRQSPMTNRGQKVRGPVLWDGWARQETLDLWLRGGRWKRGELKALSFSQGVREYELAPCDVVKVLVLQRRDGAVIKVITRAAEGRETEVANRFPVTGPGRLTA